MKKILLIDDEEGIRLCWKQFHDLNEKVYRGQLGMDTASSLATACEMMERQRYDAIILDHKMANENTEEFIIEHKGKKPPIIILTGNEDIWLRRRLMIFGASDFWTKIDASERPDLFFKSIYNRYLSHVEAF